MDDLAPAPTQRTSDNGGRAPEQNFTARKKAMKKIEPVPTPKQDSAPDLAPEVEKDHQIDILA